MRLILYVYFFLLINISYSQESIVDQSTFNNQLLEQLILKRINEVRDSLNKPPLNNDIELQQTAQIQAIYCSKIKKLTHSHKKKKFHSLRDRLNFINGVHEIIGENIASIQVGKNESSKDYKQLAHEFVKIWIKSKGHFKNIKSDDHEKSGVSVTINNNRITAVQVFGSTPINFNGYKSPAKAYYMISGRHEEQCKNCIDAIDTLHNIGTYVEGNIVYFSMKNLEYFKKIFGDGFYFSADIILRNQFPCDKNNQLHSSPFHDGYLLKPVSSKTLLKNNLQEGSIYSPIGIIPFELHEQFEANLIIMSKRKFSKKKPVCLSIIPSPSYGYNLDIMPHTIAIDTAENNNSFLIHKKMKFKIPFEKNKYNYTQEDIKPLTDSLQLNQYNITDIKIIAYSSIEGSKEHNKELQEKRANSIIKAFQSYQLDSINTYVRTLENWKEFKKGVQKSKYEYLLDFNKLEIKQALTSDSLKTALEPLLAKHRKAVILIKTEERLDTTQKPNNLLIAYNGLLNDSSTNIKEIILTQKLLFAYIIKNEFPLKALDTTFLPLLPQYSQVINNHMNLYYLISSELQDQHLLEQYISTYPKDPILKFNAYGYLIQHGYNNPYININYPKINSELKKIRSSNKIDPKEFYKMMINYHISASNFYLHNYEFDKESKSVRYILNTYNKAKLTDKDALILANFLVYHGKSKLAINLLRPYTEKPAIIEDVLFYYLSIALYSNKETHKIEFEHKMEYALFRDEERFCQLFGHPALTFQLMRNNKLKNYYCENCSEHNSTPDIKSIIGDDDLKPKIIEVE